MTSSRTSLLLIAWAMLFSSGCALVNRPVREGDTAYVRGASAEIATDYLDIRPKTGRLFRVRLGADTEFLARDRPATRDCAQPGTRLAASSVVDRGMWTAKRVVIFSGKCARP